MFALMIIIAAGSVQLYVKYKTGTPDPMNAVAVTVLLESAVSLSRVEAHPLSHQHLRVRARIKNETPKRWYANVACNFRSWAIMFDEW